MFAHIFSWFAGVALAASAMLGLSAPAVPAPPITAVTANSTQSPQNELGWLTGSLYQSAIAPQAARAPESAQMNTVTERAALMKNLAETNPAVFLGYALPKATRAKLPKSVQSQVEEQKTLTGQIEVLHIDDFSKHENSKFKYYLNTGGKRLALYSAGELPALMSGSELSIKGYQLGNVFVTGGGPAAVTVRQATKPDSVGKQRLLAILVTHPGAQQQVPTSAEMKTKIFSGAFQDYFKEQSYNKVSFAGTVTDWISMQAYELGYCYTGSSVQIGLDTPEIRDYLLQHTIDLSTYDRVVFVAADFLGGCAGVGKWNVSFNGSSYRLSLGWVGYTDYSGHPPLLSGFDYVLAHEMGHELGVMHANAWDCDGPSLIASCRHQEYGNYFDVMGQGAYSEHFNVFYKDMLGWLRPADKTVVTKTGTYTLAPLEATSGVRAVILRSPRFDVGVAPKVAYLEYRQPIGFDRLLPAQSAGIFINYLTNGTWFSNAPWLINANYATDSRHFWEWQPALMPGGSFSDSRYGIALGSVVLASTTATFTATITPPVCERHGVTVLLKDYVTDPVYPGQSGYWSFSLNNTDFPACKDSNLLVTASMSGSTGWVNTYPSEPFLLAPGLTQYAAVNFYIPIGSSPGTRVITAAIYDSTHKRTYTLQKTITVSGDIPEITITAPNGGEQWKTGEYNSVTWTPYGYNPDVNPSRDVSAYLEKKNGDIYETVGKIIESGKASIHWVGEIDSYGNYAPSGEYYVRVVNNVTGKTDRSDASFTLLSHTDASLQVTSPNGGESITLGLPYVIRWDQKNISQMGLALYKDDKWLSWISKDLAPDVIATGQLEWTPQKNKEVVAGQSVFKIYVTGRKTDGSGYVDDKSDTTFSFVDAPLPSVSIIAFDASASEAKGDRTGIYQITRTGTTTKQLPVGISVSGTATRDIDYVLSRSGIGVGNKATAVIPAGATSTTLLLTATQDTEYEGTETAVISLVKSAQYNIVSPKSARVLIKDDDPKPVGDLVPDTVPVFDPDTELQ